MAFTASQVSAIKAFAAVWFALGVGAGAIIASNNPVAVPPLTHPPTLPPADYTGSRISLTSASDVAPPEGCGSVHYPADEAELLPYLGQMVDYGNFSTPYPPPVAYADAGAPGAPTAAAAGGSRDFSTTNNQVAGVDEIDSTKTDGLYIYTVTTNHLVIVRAYPADAMEVAATVDLSGYAYGLFIDGTRLAVVLQPAYTSYPYPMAGAGAATTSLRPFWYPFENSVEVRVFDIANPAAPSLLHNYSVSGSFTGARMIGDFVYLVVGYTLHLQDGAVQYPQLTVDGTAHAGAASSIGLLTGSTNTTSVTTIFTANLTSGALPKTFSYLGPSGGEVYMSAHNLYVLGTFWNYSADWKLISTETLISKFSFYKGDVLCYFGGRAQGAVLDQFSADEVVKDGHTFLRLATTVRSASWTNASASVTVFNERLERVGGIDAIAPGEAVQASRFIGDRGYVVTFKRVDPLFVLDLSDPTAPSVIAELTLPGFSQYLQPIDAGHLIGVGVDATSTGMVSGLKLSLFDVTDAAHPREVGNYTFGGYAYSEAQYDHHALLYIASRGLLVIPVQTYDYSARAVPYGGSSWQGAYVFAVDPEQGFAVVATIAHDAVPTGADPTTGAIYTYTPTVRRSLYIGEYLYTVSDMAVKASALDGFAEVATVSIGEPYTPTPYTYAVTVPPSAGPL